MDETQGFNIPEDTQPLTIEFADPHMQARVHGGIPEDLDVSLAREVQSPSHLDYVPFSAGEALARVREFSPEDAARPAEQQRAIIGERLDRIRDQLIAQQQGIGELLVQIHDRIVADPDEPLGDLIDAAAQTLRLNGRQYSQLMRGERVFREEREAAKALFAAHPNDPAAIYEALCKQRPGDQVNASRNPASIHIQCFNGNDYATAIRGLNEHSIIPSTMPAGADDQAFAETTGASFKVYPELDRDNDETGPGYSVTIEDLSDNWVYGNQIVKVSTTEHVQNGEAYDGSYFPFHELSIVDGQRAVSIVVVEHGQIITIEQQEGSSRQTISLRRVVAEGFFRGYARSDMPDGAPVEAFQASWDGFSPGDPRGSVLEIDEFGITYTNYTPEGADVVSTQDKMASVKVARDERESQLVQDHEGQHRLNALFHPHDAKAVLFDLEVAALKSRPDAAIAKPRLLLEAARDFRRTTAELPARNEILAHLAEGMPAADILNTLLADYDYRNYDGNEAHQQSWKEGLAKRWSEDFVLVGSDGDRVGPLIPTDTEMQEALDQAFGPEYMGRLRKWTDVIEELQAAGHSNERILNLLYQEPTSHWVRVASILDPEIRAKLRARADARKNASSATS